jgi:hypothetical protein
MAVRDRTDANALPNTAVPTVTNFTATTVTLSTPINGGTGHVTSGDTIDFIQYFYNNSIITNNKVFAWGNNGSGTPGLALQNLGANTTISGNDLDPLGLNNNPTGNASPCNGIGCAPHEPFPNPTLSLGTYYSSIGGSPATTAGFIAAVRLQAKNNWNPLLTASNINAYWRKNAFGFDAVNVQRVPQYCH